MQEYNQFKKRKDIEYKVQMADLKRQKRLAKEYAKSKKEPLSFSKWITATVVVCWVLNLVVNLIMYVTQGIYSKEILTAVSTIAVPTILSYAVKSGYENHFKIMKNK